MKSPFVTRSPKTMLLGLLSIALLASAAQAATPWSTPSGDNIRFAWSGGQNTDANFFESPTITDLGFFFSPSNFRAEVTTPGLGDVAADVALVDINVFGANGGGGAPPISYFKIAEWGTYDGDILDFSVKADANVTRVIPPMGPTGILDLAAVAWDYNGPGTWYTERTFWLDDPPNWSLFAVTYSNSIEVEGDAPVGSFIEKNGAMIILPEPSSLAVLLVGLGLTAVRRRARR